jgi:hypothetical protein
MGKKHIKIIKHKKTIKKERKEKYNKWKKKTKIYLVAKKICFPTPPHLPTPYLDIQIWSDVKKKHDISSKKLEGKKS